MLASFRLHEVAKLEVFLVSRDLFPGLAISAITFLNRPQPHPSAPHNFHDANLKKDSRKLQERILG
ncbi:MAG: hypothetical protein DMG05_01115 [Acidobacteria bacterium]|nr:MAG: hypothetical protein DMG05_01115 [Acidobacteriota bacterium]